uniref:Uncharacterized protein n=1 Tax=Glossina austeni TaxID=7395 RepID=A0A1A9VC41_GLOAU
MSRVSVSIGKICKSHFTMKPKNISFTGLPVTGFGAHVCDDLHPPVNGIQPNHLLTYKLQQMMIIIIIFFVSPSSGFCFLKDRIQQKIDRKSKVFPLIIDEMTFNKIRKLKNSDFRNIRPHNLKVGNKGINSVTILQSVIFLTFLTIDRPIILPNISYFRYDRCLLPILKIVMERL